MTIGDYQVSFLFGEWGYLGLFILVSLLASKAMTLITEGVKARDIPLLMGQIMGAGIVALWLLVTAVCVRLAFPVVFVS